MRLHHLDNLRTTMVLCVLLLHAVLAFTISAPWWYAADPDKLPGLELLVFLLDSFPLPILFFLAGYFGSQSLASKGTGLFLRSKLIRLGLPFLFVTATVLPLIPWTIFSSRNALSLSPFDFWTTFLSDALIPSWTLVQAPPDFVQQGLHFSQFHLWFISLLLCFFLLHSLLFHLFAQRRSALTLSPLSGLIIGGICISLLMALIGLFMHEWSWLNTRWLLFQPIRLPLYLGCYIIGVVANDRSWLSNGSLPGSIWIWFTTTIIFTGSYVLISSQLMMHPGPLPFHSGLIQAIIRTGLCLAWLGLLLTFFKRRIAFRGPISQSLAANSYTIYLLHLPMCVVLQAVLAGTTLGVPAKIGIVCTGSLALSVAGAELLKLLKGITSKHSPEQD